MAPLLASSPDTSFDGSIRLASVFPAVGRYAASGIQSENGARLAVEDVNGRGGIHGRRLKLLPYRTGSYFVDARHAAELAVAEGEVVAVIGSNSSSLSMSIAEVAESREVVQVSNVSTAEDLTWDPATGREREYVFRTCASDSAMGAILARFARHGLGARRVAVLYEVGRAYSARLARNFIKPFNAPEEGRVAKEFFYLPLETDYRSQLREITAFAPDVLFVPSAATDATLIAVQAQPLGLTATLLGADGWSQRGLFASGGPSQPAYYADLCSPPEGFKDRYRHATGAEADGCRAVLAYDAVLAMARSLAALGPLSDADLLAQLPATRKRLRARLARVELTGLTGRIRFGPHRSRDGGMAIMQVGPTAGGGYARRFHVWPDVH